MNNRSGKDILVCPFIDSNNRRCAKKLSLASIGEAFDMCFGAYEACPIYQQLLKEKTYRTEDKFCLERAFDKEMIAA